MSNIPKEYQWHDGVRQRSPIGSSLDKVQFNHLACPCCKRQSLQIGETGDLYPDVIDYFVYCGWCDWESPTGTNSDYGDTIVEFKEWLEAFYLLDEPHDRLDEDLRDEFGPTR